MVLTLLASFTDSLKNKMKKANNNLGYSSHINSYIEPKRKQPY